MGESIVKVRDCDLIIATLGKDDKLQSYENNVYPQSIDQLKQYTYQINDVDFQQIESEETVEDIESLKSGEIKDNSNISVNEITDTNSKRVNHNAIEPDLRNNGETPIKKRKKNIERK